MSDLALYLPAALDALPSLFRGAAIAPAVGLRALARGDGRYQFEHWSAWEGNAVAVATFLVVVASVAAISFANYALVERPATKYGHVLARRLAECCLVPKSSEMV